MQVYITRGKEEYELEVDYTWEDKRLGLLKVDIQQVIKVGSEEDIDPTLFEESITDSEMADIESQIRDKK